VLQALTDLDAANRQFSASSFWKSICGHRWARIVTDGRCTDLGIFVIFKFFFYLADRGSAVAAAAMADKPPILATAACFPVKLLNGELVEPHDAILTET
jgi:hypothetical protein